VFRLFLSLTLVGCAVGGTDPSTAGGAAPNGSDGPSGDGGAEAGDLGSSLGDLADASPIGFPELDGGNGIVPLNTSPGSADGEGDAPAPKSRVGRYAERIVYQQVQTIDGSIFFLPLSGVILNTNTTYSLVTLTDSGLLVQNLCDVLITSEDGDGNSAMFVSDLQINPVAFNDLGALQREVRWTDSGLELPLNDVAVGWRQQMLGEVLPTDASDPRVIDADNDGQPGITITISSALVSGDVYAVQRIRNRVVAKFEGDAITGEVFDMSEQSVVGGTITETQQTVTAAGDSTTNRYDLVPLDDPDLTCGDLVADPQKYFPQHPVLSGNAP
jgi:hypothetical protein